MTARPRFRTLVEILDYSVATYADRPLIGTKRAGAWRFSTYAELGRRVVRLRSALEAVGVVPGDRVGIISRNRPEWVTVAYAAYSARAAVVALHETQTSEELSFLLRDSGVKVLFVANAEVRARVDALRADLPELERVVVFDGAGDESSVSFDAMFALGTGEDGARGPVEPGDLASILYTSGTTGRPKGVELTHENIAHNVSALHQIFPISPDDRSLSILPWAHVFGQTVELHGLLSMGASIALASSIEDVPTELVEVQPSLLFGFPKLFCSFYDRLLSEVEEAEGIRGVVLRSALDNAVARKELARERRVSGLVELKQMAFERIVFEKVRARFGGRLRYAFSGGAALPRRVAELIDNLGILIYEGYGLTETSPIVSCNFPGSRKIGSAGKPLPGVRVEIDTSVADDPKLGEIVVFGSTVMKGYRGRPEEDAKVFVERGEERGLRTGDLGYLDGEGYLHIEGRVTDQYRLASGRFVMPTSLEETLKLSHYIASVMVYGDGRPYNVAVIAPNFRILARWADERQLAGGPKRLMQSPLVRGLFEDELARYSEGFRAHEKIRDFLLVEADFTVANGMLTATQKVRRAKVIAQYGEELDAIYARR